MKAKSLIISGAALLTLTSLIGFEVKRAAQPIVRETIAQPLYTIGERSSYSQALAEGTQVLKFGPMFLGLYPGGLAFATPEAARDYLRDGGWDLQRWSVYRLSGDYALDAQAGYITASQLVLAEAG